MVPHLITALTGQAPTVPARGVGQTRGALLREHLGHEQPALVRLFEADSAAEIEAFFASGFIAQRPPSLEDGLRAYRPGGTL